ncbi:MAG: hypothetical protein PVJ57_04915 [Phycisphaerae bacterium]|jgi:hypothetical protein
MNYLGHFVYNHEIRRLTPDAHFVMGVALPDLWPRFSRRRRIRWKMLRAAQPSATADVHLRAGLLNHVETDRLFHALPCFGQWQRTLRASLDDGEPHPLIAEFLTHLAIELALDGRLVRDDPERAERFYDTLAACDVADVERRITVLGSVDARGLGDEIAGFIGRRFLGRCGEVDVLAGVVQWIVSLTTIREPPAMELLQRLLAHAIELVEPSRIWQELARLERPA